MAGASSDSLWMIRTTDLMIRGPYSVEQVKDLIVSGKLTQQDEVCQANGYWFFLHERDEVVRRLGVDPSHLGRPAYSDQELELTQTETEIHDIHAQAVMQAEKAVKDEAQTGVIHVQSYRAAQASSSPAPKSILTHIPVTDLFGVRSSPASWSSSMLQTSFWLKFIALLLFFGVIILAAYVLKKSQGEMS